MPDLRGALWQREPDEAPFNMAEVHQRAGRMRTRRRRVQGTLSAVVILAVVGAGVWAVRPSPPGVVLESGPTAGAIDDGPPAVERQPEGVWLSHERVSAAGQPVMFAVVADGAALTYGADGLIQGWDGAGWVEFGGLSTRFGGPPAYGTFTPGEGPIAVEGIQLATEANGIGAVERVALPALDLGWYRIAKVTSGGLRTAAFEVVEGADPVAPVLDPDGADLSVEPEALTVVQAAEGRSLGLRAADGAPPWIEQIDWRSLSDPSAPPAVTSISERQSLPPIQSFVVSDMTPGLWQATAVTVEGDVLIAFLPVIDPSRMPALEPGWYRIGKQTMSASGVVRLHTATFQAVETDFPVAPHLRAGADLIVDPSHLTVAEADADATITVRLATGLAFGVEQIAIEPLTDPDAPAPPSVAIAAVDAPGPSVEIPLGAPLSAGVWLVRVRLASGEELYASLAVIDPLLAQPAAEVEARPAPIATPRPSATPTAIDGQLDCLGGNQWDMTSEIDDNATGFADPVEAVERALLEMALRDDIHLEGQVGAIVLDGREVVRAAPTRLTDGTWLVTSSGGCSADSQPEWRIGALAGPCPTTGAEAGTVPDFVVVYGQLMEPVDEPVRPDQLGSAILTTRCRMQDGVWPDGEFRGGDSGQLPPGTSIHQIVGFSDDQRVAAVTLDGIIAYAPAAPAAAPTSD